MDLNNQARYYLLGAAAIVFFAVLLYFMQPIARPLGGFMAVGTMGLVVACLNAWRYGASRRVWGALFALYAFFVVAEVTLYLTASSTIDRSADDRASFTLAAYLMVVMALPMSSKDAMTANSRNIMRAAMLVLCVVAAAMSVLLLRDTFAGFAWAVGAMGWSSLNRSKNS